MTNPTHVLYENEVLENKITDLVNTLLDCRSLLTVDNSLTGAAGLQKTINKYTYSGQVEKLAKGAKNTDSTKGKVTYVGTTYEIERYQHTFVYNDMDVAQDPFLLDVQTKGCAEIISNHMKQQYFDELKKISNTMQVDAPFCYDTIVDALATINREVEDDTFVIMGNDLKAAIRHDDDYKSSRQGEILYTGQFGTVCGLPVLFSKLVPAKTCYVTTKDAVTLFVKKEANVEQDRDIESKDNTVVYERLGLMALTDDTKSIIVKVKDPAPVTPPQQGSGQETGTE